MHMIPFGSAYKTGKLSQVAGTTNQDVGPFHVLYLTYHFVCQFYSGIIVLVQSSFHTTWASLFEMELIH